MRKISPLVFTLVLVASMAMSGCKAAKRPYGTPTDSPIAPPGAGIKDPTTLAVQDIDVSELREHQEGDLKYPGMSGSFYDLAIERGAKAVVIPEYSTHFIYWLPDNWSDLNEKRVIILMHGHDGTAAPRLNDLYESAAKYGLGMVSIQWGWRPGKGQEYRYLDETVDGMKVSYHIMEIALDYIALHHGVDKGLSAWNGFSRSSGHSIAYAYLDKESGNNYFQLFMGIAGGLNIVTPFIGGLADGEYGEDPVKGKAFYLWCGTADEIKEERKVEGYPDMVCGRQELSKDILVERGGIIKGFTATPNAGHMTWNSKSELQEEAIEIWLSMG
jgi:hypothetical protein